MPSRLLSIVLLFISWLAACGQKVPTSDAKGPVPWTQVLNPIHQGAVLSFTHPEQFVVEVGTSLDANATNPDHWQRAETLPLPHSPGQVKVFARMKDAGADYGSTFSWTYEVVQAYPPPAGEQGSKAIAMDDERIVSWATDIVQVDFGQEVDEQWKDGNLALGPADGTSTGVLCLGRGGSVVLGFDPPIGDGQGEDFAIFENGINDTFLELATVEVSTDGKTFLSFASAYLGHESIDPYGQVDTRQVGGLAGKYRQGFGTPFDLALLRQAPEVLNGSVDLDDIKFVRIKDLVGDGSQKDSFGNPIYDPYPTSGSAGFDLDAVAVLNQGF